MEFSQIHLCSSIGKEYYHDLEEMFFFNPRQHVVRDRVAQHIERYGTPEILRHDEAITIGLGRVDHAQTLFMMMGGGRGVLVGVVIHVREGERLKILYFAMKPAYPQTLQARSELLWFMVNSIRNIGKRIKGIRYIDWCVGSKDCTFKI
jgi:hypothetical protein